MPEPEPGPQPHIVEIRAVGKTFQGPSEMPSGWITFRLINASSMVHFGIIDVPPEGVTIEMLSDEVMTPFQDAMDAMNVGDEEAANAAFGRIPEWMAELGRNGGPGMLSPGRIGEMPNPQAAGFVLTFTVAGEQVRTDTPVWARPPAGFSTAFAYTSAWLNRGAASVPGGAA